MLFSGIAKLILINRIYSIACDTLPL